MVNIGYTIKLERKKQNMKQISLAKGICSNSYLSKIENGTAIASKEVINLLLERLNIDYVQETTSPITNNGNSLQEELNKIYKEVTLFRNREFAKEKLEHLNQIKISSDKSTFIFLQLVIFRISLFFNKKAESKVYIDFLETYLENFTNYHKYLFKKNLGIYYQQNQDIKQSIQFFTEAFELTHEILLEDWEKADLYYMLGVVSVSNEKIVETIEYSYIALRYFKDSLYLQRALECYLLLGIAYKKANRSDKSLEMYQLALKISKEHNLEKYNGIIYQNIGSLYSYYQSDKAIYYYKNSFLYKKRTNEQLITIFSLVIEYYKYENWKEMNHWIDRGFQLINNNMDAKKDYIHHFLIYQELSLYKSLSEKVVVPSINFFNSIQDYRHCYKYNYMLGQSMFKQSKYKSASIYFQEAHSYLLKLKKLKRLEDL
ncbi:helix-turn-helix domain-containing protein [Ornithinibacillus contaminans]|uniref:helix-turn-helix domain-containing protein n=1 Tax=Ornithinibacillus contaminans TaxID=694055 RepID=UPI00064D7A96|nr:helix-turn-helix domain-containing protein [Ornithinibacillus contaminans]